MRFMMVARSQFPVPPELLPSMIDGFTAWWENYQSKWESAGFFAGENGGGGICHVADEAEFHQMMLAWPLTPFSLIEAHALVEMDTALSQWKEAIASMMAQQQGMSGS